MGRHTPKGAKKVESSKEYEARKLELRQNSNKKAKVNKGGKEHHCPVDGHAIASDTGKTKCIGTHCLPCPKFHDTPLRMGRGHACASCRQAERMQWLRNEELAAILAQLHNGPREDAWAAPRKKGKAGKGPNPLKSRSQTAIVPRKLIESVARITAEITDVELNTEGAPIDLQLERRNQGALLKRTEMRLIKAVESILTGAPDASLAAARVFAALNVDVEAAAKDKTTLATLQRLDAALADSLQILKSELAKIADRRRVFFAEVPGEARILQLMEEQRLRRVGGDGDEADDEASFEESTDDTPDGVVAMRSGTPA